MTDTAMTYRRILMLCDANSNLRPMVEQQFAGATIKPVHSIEDAVRTIEREKFDLIVAEHNQFPLIESLGAAMQASTVLELLGHGVCIVGKDGVLTWTNKRMQTHPKELRDAIAEQCRKFLMENVDSDRPPRSRHFSYNTPDDQHFEITTTPIAGPDGKMSQMAAVAWDITRARRLQKKIDAIDKAGRELVEMDRDTVAHLTAEERLQFLEKKIYTYLHDLLHFDNFVVMLLNRTTNHLDVVLQNGILEEVRRLDIYASTEDNGISGYVAATGRSYICPSTRNDPRYIQGLERAGSSLTVPLRLHEEVVGVLDIESEQLAAFNEDDRQFAEILGRYVAMALNVFDLLVTERFTTTGRLADDVAGEIAAPLNDILTQAATLMEDYIGHDDLRKRLGAICDDVAAIRQRIRDMGRPQCGVLGTGSGQSMVDPLLSGKRILIADDEELIRDTIAGILEHAGCLVDTACDGADAVQKISQNEYDLVMADITMPKCNGYEVFAKARDRFPDRPVILITGFGYDPGHSIVRARREGLKAVLFKPFKFDVLMEEVRSAFVDCDK